MNVFPISARRPITGVAGIAAAALSVLSLVLTSALSPALADAGRGYASGLPWSSGAFTSFSAEQAEGFAEWRGRPLDNITIFPDQRSWESLNDPWFLSDAVIPRGFTGDVVAAVPLWPRNSDIGTNANAQWRTFAGQLAAHDPQAYVRLGWEMNIGQYWRVTRANRDAWVAAFHRAAVAMHSVAPHLRIVWNPNWGPDQVDIDTRDVFQAVKDDVSVYGIDMYDAWPATSNDLNSALRIYGDRAMTDSLTYAMENGKRFALPEWGVACGGAGCQWAGDAGGDNPRYIRETLLFLKSHAAEVAFDSYFNDPQPYIRSALYPGQGNPQAGQAYRSVLAEYASG